MGLGKTVQAIAALTAFRDDDWPFLVICPRHAVNHWEDQLIEWLGEIPQRRHRSITDASQPHQPLLEKSDILCADNGKCNIGKFLKRGGKVVVCTTSLVHNLKQNRKLKEGMFDAIIVDESQSLRDKNTGQTKAILPLLAKAKRVILLSGTPSKGKPMELWTQVSAIASGKWGEKEFREEFGNHDSYVRLAKLCATLQSSIMLRRRKDDVLGGSLLPKDRQLLFLEVEDEGTRASLARRLERLTSAQGDSFVAQLMQIEEDEGNKELIFQLYMDTGKAKVQGIVKLLQKWLVDQPKEKLCIFAHHRHVLNALERGGEQ